MINRVTITGADKLEYIPHLHELNKEFPFLENGILLSQKRMGQARYPDKNFFKGLFDVWVDSEMPFNLSLHICGNLNSYIARGDFFPEIIRLQEDEEWDLTEVDMFQRIQLNGILSRVKDPMDFYLGIKRLLPDGPYSEIILQYDEKHVQKASALISHNVPIACLFDKSGGTGITPGEWPQAFVLTKCGYAGGIGPNNIEQEIERILEKRNGQTVWIDMESGVRTNNQFDLDKVYECLTKAAKYVV